MIDCCDIRGNRLTSKKHTHWLFITSSAVVEMGDRLATVNIGRKVGDCFVPFCGGSCVPSNTMWPGPRPTSMPSGILMHPVIWLQQIWVVRGSPRFDRFRPKTYVISMSQAMRDRAVFTTEHSHRLPANFFPRCDLLFGE